MTEEEADGLAGFEGTVDYIGGGRFEPPAGDAVVALVEEGLHLVAFNGIADDG